MGLYLVTLPVVSGTILTPRRNAVLGQVAAEVADQASDFYH